MHESALQKNHSLSEELLQLKAEKSKLATQLHMQ
jgi:hypothetical protein